ncbi:MAG: 16S rRNA (uracil(1498)-N(3))-methyltransferase, partial [Clostridia bacterium]|nr:16S rRNA (uracil(1498)-N(3))-methyltransferase [Clostridia bacterium]
MRRFFASADCFADGFVTFDASESNHICRVLRLSEGENILVWDGSGTDYLCELASVGARCRARVLKSERNTRETACELALFQAVIKNE